MGRRRKAKTHGSVIADSGTLTDIRAKVRRGERLTLLERRVHARGIGAVSYSGSVEGYAIGNPGGRIRQVK